MPLFSKKKAETKAEDKEKAKEEVKKDEKKEEVKAKEEEEDEETDSEDEETGSEDETDGETESESEAVKKETKDEKTSGKAEVAVKKDEKKEDSESEDEESEDEDDESEDESEPEETEKTETQEEITTAQDATMDMSEAPTDFGDTLATEATEDVTEADDVTEEEEEMFEAIDDYAGEEDGDLAIAVGDRLTIIHKQEDGWWEAENERGERGIVPSTYLKQIDRPQSPSSPKSGKMLWGSVKKAIKQTSATDVLHMMGSVPTGFRKEFLKPRCETKKTSAALMPKLSPSNLFFNDLMFSPSLGQIKSRPSQWCRIIALNEFRNIPLPGKGTKVLKRFVRICLYDGSEVCSNVICIEAVCTDKEEKIWSFNQKDADQMQSGRLGLIFVRTNQKNVGILFELNVIFLRESANTETHMICGWGDLPLYDEDGNPSPCKALEININGGTPAEKGVPLDAMIGATEQSSMFRSLLMRNRAPHFSFRVSQPSKEQKELLDMLPDNIIGSAAHINAFSIYRQVLADQLLRDRMDMMSTDPISDPYLAQFPNAANDPYLMDVLRNGWLEVQKKLSRQQKKDPNTIKTKFVAVFMDKVYPRLCLTDEHYQKEKPILGNPVRTPRYMDPLSMLLSPEAQFRPFHTDEVAFNIINEYCTKPW